MENILTVLIYICIIINFSLLLFSYTRQDHARSKCISTMSFYTIIYLIGYLAEVRSHTLEGMTAALWMENFAIPMIAPLFLYSTITFFDPKKIRKWFIPVSFIYSMFMFSSVVFNDYLFLYYKEIAINTNGALTLTYGPLFIIQQLVSLTCLIVAYYLLFKRFISGSAALRRQMYVFILAAMITFVCNGFNILGILPQGVDIAPFSFTISLLLFTLDLLSHRLLDIQLFAFDSAIHSMDDAIIVLDNDEGFVYSNISANKIFPTVAALGDLEKITNASQWPKELILIEDVGEIDFELIDDSLDNRTYRASISRIKSEGKRNMGWSVVLRDITELVCTMKKMQILAITDSLTGIYNRHHFLEFAKKELLISKTNNHFNVLLSFDVDHFKKINDTYGHSAGDQVLCAVTRSVQSHIKSTDLFARIGGEEFAVFSVNKNPINLFEFAENLRKEISLINVIYNDIIITTSASFGIISIPQDCSFEKAMNAVDLVMYEAKYNGRNQVKVGDTIIL